MVDMKSCRLSRASESTRFAPAAGGYEHICRRRYGMVLAVERSSDDLNLQQALRITLAIKLSFPSGPAHFACHKHVVR